MQTPWAKPLVLLAMSMLFSAINYPSNLNKTYGPGETLVYSVKYGFFPGGFGRLEVLDTVRNRGRLCHQIRAVAHSNKGLSLVFPVRDTNISIIDAQGLFSHRIAKYIREGRYVRFRTTDFSPDIGLARTVDHTVMKDSSFTTQPFIHDIMSAFYYFRTLNITDSVEIPCLDDFKSYPLRVRIVAKERIKTDLGKFDCIVVEPLLASSGIFLKKGKLTIWMTNDERRLPVLVKFHLPYLGDITCTLIEYKQPRIIDQCTLVP